MTNEIVREKLKKAIDKLYQEDSDLIQNMCCERSIVYRLTFYLEELFNSTDINVDCEYNRNGNGPKSLKERKLNYPDIIIHRRGENTNNLLIVEVKTSNIESPNDIGNDQVKLIGFTTEDPYLYSLGAHVYISTSECRIAWYIRGEVQNYDVYSIAQDSCALNQIELTDVILCKFDKFYIKEPIKAINGKIIITMSD